MFPYIAYLILFNQEPHDKAACILVKEEQVNDHLIKKYYPYYSI